MGGLTMHNNQTSGGVMTGIGCFPYYENRDDLGQAAGQIIDHYIDLVSRIGWQTARSVIR
jgi:hypothetical protein